jgi:hypothetical protein
LTWLCTTWSKSFDAIPDPESQDIERPTTHVETDKNAPPFIGRLAVTGRTTQISRRQPFDSATSRVPVSSILSIPCTHPGRILRQNCIHPSPLVSYGDPIIQKANGSVRLFFQDVKGLTYTTAKEDYNNHLKCIQGLEVDIMGL